MHTTISRGFLLISLALPACAGAEFTVAEGNPDAGRPDSGTVGSGGDTGSGGSGGDSGAAGSETGGGGSDTGPGGMDGGTDAATDSGSAGSDGGLDAGSGGSDGGSDAGSGGDSGTGGTDGGTPECTGDILGCFPGDQPKVCSGGKWMLSGGVCNYGCSGGKCACSASGRFTNPSGPTGPFKDAKTALAWATIGSGPQDYATTLAYCTATLSGYRMPTVAEVQSILSQMEPSIFCDPNVDPVILEHLKLQVWSGLPLTSILNADVWTKDTSGGLQRTVNLKTGASGTRDPATKYANVFFCVK